MNSDIMWALDELDGSEFEAIRGHSTTLRTRIAAQDARIEALEGAWQGPPYEYGTTWGPESFCLTVDALNEARTWVRRKEWGTYNYMEGSKIHADKQAVDLKIAAALRVLGGEQHGG